MKSFSYLILLFLIFNSCTTPVAPSLKVAPSNPQIEALNNRFEIFELAYKFADAANRKDGDLFQSLWVDNGAEWIIGAPINKKFEGKEKMGSSVTYMLNLWEFFVQMVEGGVVTLTDENHAFARFYVNEVANSKDGKGNYNLSMYEDELVKENGQWRFKKRTYHTIFQSRERQNGMVIAAPKLSYTGHYSK